MGRDMILQANTSGLIHLGRELDSYKSKKIVVWDGPREKELSTGVPCRLGKAINIHHNQ